MRGNPVFWCSFLCFVLVWLYLLSIYIRRRTQGSKKQWVQVTARVVYIHEKQGRGRHGGHITMYQPTFEYDWRGFKRTLRMDAWDSTLRFRVGDEIELLIDPDNAAHYRYKNILMEPAMKMLLGFGFMVLIIIVLQLTNRK